MFILKLLRYVSGVVVFSAKGGFSDRFINLCTFNKIHIRDVRYGENMLEAAINPKKYKKLRSIAKKSGMKLKVEKKYGLPFFIRKNRNRVGLVFGVLFAIVFLAVTSSFVWTVEVTGGENVRVSDVIEVCENLGLKEGVLKRNIDTNDLSRLAMIELSGKVSWLSVNVKGTKAVVEIRDYEPWREDSTYKEPCNIIADFDGLLLTLEVYNGMKAAKEGNGIKEGDLLISGIVENMDTSSQFMEARGKITALHTDFVDLSIEKQSENKFYERCENVTVLNAFGINIPLGMFEKSENPYDEFHNEKHLTYGKNKLPLSVDKISRIYYKTKSVIKDSSVHSAVDEHTVSAYEKYKNTLILESKYSLSENSGIIEIKSANECIDFLGKKQIIYIE